MTPLTDERLLWQNEWKWKLMNKFRPYISSNISHVSHVKSLPHLLKAHKVHLVALVQFRVSYLLSSLFYQHKTFIKTKCDIFTRHLTSPRLWYPFKDITSEPFREIFIRSEKCHHKYLLSMAINVEMVRSGAVKGEDEANQCEDWMRKKRKDYFSFISLIMEVYY